MLGSIISLRFGESLTARVDSAAGVIVSPFFLLAMWPLVAGSVLAGAAHAVGRYPLPPFPVAVVLGATGLAATAGGVYLTAAGDFMLCAVMFGELSGYVGGLAVAAAPLAAVHRFAVPLASTAVGAVLVACGRRSLVLYLGQVWTLAFVAQSWGLALHGAFPGWLGACIALAATVATVAAGACSVFGRRVVPGWRPSLCPAS